MAIEYAFTPGGNKYPVEGSDYDQSKFWLDIALSRDTKDNDIIQAAVAASLTQDGNVRHVGALPPGTDLNSITTTQFFRLSPNGGYLNLPPNFPSTSAGVGFVSGASGKGENFRWGAQVIFEHGDSPKANWRVSSTASPTWNSWTAFGSGGGGEVASVSAVGMGNALRQQAMRDHYGPISSGGKGGVGWRFDHYLNSFNASIRGLFEARGMKYLLALDSRRWDDAQNNQVTKSQVNSWVAGGLAEIWGHGTDHADHTGYEALFDFLVNSKRELEADLPAAKIWGFVVPGVGGTGLGGFLSGNSIESFTDTIAGQLILKYYAVSSGAFSGTSHRIMDGTIRQGQSHYGIETATAAQMIAQVDQAIANKTYVQFMMHPWRLDTSGGITSADLVTVMDYVKSKIDAGELANLSPYESALATA